MDRRLDWVARKGVLAIALYFAIVGGIGWLQYAIAAYVWLPLASNLWSVASGGAWRSIARTGVRPTASATFDLAVLGSMFLAHWYWTACAYAVACGFAALTQAHAPSKP